MNEKHQETLRRAMTQLFTYEMRAESSTSDDDACMAYHYSLCVRHKFWYRNTPLNVTHNLLAAGFRY